MKLKIVIHGPKVHNVGYRYFLLSNADNLGLKGFSARNMKANGHQAVQILVEGDDCQIHEFQEIVEIRTSSESLISEMKNAGERNAVDLRESHIDLKSYLDDKLGKIEVDISRIKARIGM